MLWESKRPLVGTAAWGGPARQRGPRKRYRNTVVPTLPEEEQQYLDKLETWQGALSVHGGGPPRLTSMSQSYSG